MKTRRPMQSLLIKPDPHKPSSSQVSGISEKISKRFAQDTWKAMQQGLNLDAHTQADRLVIGESMRDGLIDILTKLEPDLEFSFDDTLDRRFLAGILVGNLTALYPAMKGAGRLVLGFTIKAALGPAGVILLILDLYSFGEACVAKAVGPGIARQFLPELSRRVDALQCEIQITRKAEFIAQATAEMSRKGFSEKFTAAYQESGGRFPAKMSATERNQQMINLRAKSLQELCFLDSMLSFWDTMQKGIMDMSFLSRAADSFRAGATKYYENQVKATEQGRLLVPGVYH